MGDDGSSSSSSSVVSLDLRPFLVVYEDGRVERLLGKDTVPADDPSDDVVHVSSKDVHFSQSPPISARLYLPGPAGSPTPTPTPTLPPGTRTRRPLIVYFHGGAFAIESAFSPTYHRYLRRLSAESSAVIVSVNYRLAPEHPLPAAYDDCWSAVQWVLSSEDPWISKHADLSNRLFLAGDSAGANIAHRMAIRFGNTNINIGDGSLLAGLVLIHPFFLGEDPIYGDNGPDRVVGRDFGRRVWTAVSGLLDPEKQKQNEYRLNLDHPWINPDKDEVELLEKMIGVCEKVLVFVAEKDSLRNRGVWYADHVLGKIISRLSSSSSSSTSSESNNGMKKVELIEARGEDHVFHLFNPDSENALKMMDKLVHFIATTTTTTTTTTSSSSTTTTEK